MFFWIWWIFNPNDNYDHAKDGEGRTDGGSDNDGPGGG